MSQRTALAWRPSQRSPMALFPHCNSLSLELINDAPLLRLEERLRNRAAAGGDSEDEVDEPLWFGQDALARMALFGTAAETRARITELSISLSYHGERPALDVASVLAALAPELSALQSITFEGEADPIGMGPGDHVRSALLHAALSTHAPRLHKLVLPSAPGMLRGVGSLAAGCVCLKELWLPLFVNDMPAESLGPVLLRAEEVAGLSALPALETLALRCHDPSPTGANFASLLGARRPRALRRLELVASVPLHAADEAAGAGADGSWPRTPHAHFPPMVAEFEPLPGRIVCVKTDDEFATCVETDFGPAALDRLAGVLVAAVQSLPLRCGLSRLHLRTYALSARALRLRAAAGGEGPQQELEQQGGFGDGATTLARCLGLGGRLPLLAECAELDFLDASTAVSPAAVCAVLRVLGLPADQLCLHHGTWWQSTAQPIGGGNQTVGTAARLLQLVGQVGQAHEQHGKVRLQLETADAQGLLQEAVERLWRAAAPLPGGAASPPQRPGGPGSLVLLRGAPPLPTPPLLKDRHRLQNGNTASADRAARTLCAHMAMRLDALLAQPPAAAAAGSGSATAGAGSSTGGGGAPSRHLEHGRGFASVPCAGALLVECGSPLHAAALAEAVKSTAAATGGGFAAAVIPDGITDAVPYPGACHGWPRCGAVLQLAVLTVSEGP